LSWIALVIALLIEQARPLLPDNPVYEAVRRLGASAARTLNAGHSRHGVLAWSVLVLGLTVLAAVVFAALVRLNWGLGLAFDVAVLYLTLGFRQFSHHGTEIQIALGNGDLASAQRELRAWKKVADPAYSADGLDAGEVARQAIEHGLLLSQRHVFGVLFWFLVLPGPSGAVLYRVAEHLARRWNPPAGAVPKDSFGAFARRAFAWIDWVPARLTALGFAVVGDFEGAVYCWRQASQAGLTTGTPGPDSRTLILAAASGALGRRLLPQAEQVRWIDQGDPAALGEAEAGTVRSAVGLVWRALLLWLALLLLLTLAHLAR
jgi:adenosylcobinamide-phosphate synthase